MRISFLGQDGYYLGASRSEVDSFSGLFDSAKYDVQVTRAETRASLQLSVTAAGALVGLYSPAAGAASSASFQISASTFDVAGGSASSASHQVQSCVGSEIAGTAGSNSFRVDSGCGVTLGFVGNPLATQEALPVPALHGTSAIVLAMVLGALALLQVRRGFFSPMK